MRQDFAKGIDANALEKYTKHLKKLAEDNPAAKELVNLSLSLDYVPMISASVAMRYGCRCGKIPKSETGWFNAKQPHVPKLYWFCPACSGEFTFNTTATSRSSVDSKGQDKPCQYVLFIQVPWGKKGETRTFCAKAMAPSNIQQQELNVI